MSHNTYDNIVKNKGNIDYCIEVLFSCHDFTDFIPCNIRQPRYPAYNWASIRAHPYFMLVAKANYVALRQQIRQFLTGDPCLFFFSNSASLRTASGA